MYIKIGNSKDKEKGKRVDPVILMNYASILLSSFIIGMRPIADISHTLSLTLCKYARLIRSTKDS